MKKYYQNYRRGKNLALFLVPGGIFLAVGILAFWATTSIALVVLSLCAGVLLIVLPLPFLFARYGVQGGCVRCVRRGIPRSVPLAELSLILCIYDEYRRWKGFQPAVFRGSDGEVTVPALVLVQGLSPEEIEKELDLCDTRMNARFTYGKNAACDMLLDFDFLRDLVAAGFAGRVYVSEFIYGLYSPAIDDIFGKGGVTVYDRIPYAVKQKRKG